MDTVGGRRFPSFTSPRIEDGQLMFQPFLKARLLATLLQHSSSSHSVCKGRRAVR